MLLRELLWRNEGLNKDKTPVECKRVTRGALIDRVLCGMIQSKDMK